MSKFVQTGVQGAPSEPFVVSFGVVGTHDVGGPDLRPATRQMRGAIEGLKAHHRQEGWLGWDEWLLMRVTPDSRNRSWVYDDGVLDEKRWEEAVDGVPERYDTVLLSSGLWGQLQLAAPSHDHRGSAVRALTAWVEAPTAGVDEAAAALREQLVAAAEVAGVLTGFVHVDSIPDPYTAVMTDISRLSADAFASEVHGYYWAVLLTDGHLEWLGGLTSVRREAPCERVQPLELGDRRGVLCTLTDSPLDLDADRVAAWREFLLPVLRAGYPTGWEEIGQRRTPLHRPLRLFEGDPAPRLIGFSIAGDYGTGGSPLPVAWSGHVQDPERPTCWLYPGPAFDRERHPGAVDAVVNAWFVTGVHGRLFEVEGALHSATSATWDTDDDGVEALAWQVEFGNCDPEAAIERLAAALTELAGVLGGSVFNRLRIA